MDKKDSTATREDYLAAVFEGLVVQMICFVVSALTLDLGETLQISLMAMFAFWCGVGLIVLRRPRSPTRVDLWIIRWGYVPLVILMQPAVRWVWHWRGVL